MSLIAVLAAASSTFWILVVLDRRRAWPGGWTLPPRAEQPGQSAESRPSLASREIAVVVPARNEAAVLLDTLPTLLDQADDFRTLIVVDDRSADGTGEIARRLRDAAGLGSRVQVIDAPPPPAGWSGKLHALETGVRWLAASGGDAPRWILFTDADVCHPPGSIASLRRLALVGRFDVVSVMVRLRAETFWERLLMPPFVYFFQLLYPFRRVSDAGSSVAAAAGGCILLSRDLLERVGGLARLRSAVIDDVSLARVAKAAGGRLWLGLCQDMVSVRAYPRLMDIAHMVARTAFTQLRHSYALTAVTLAGLAGLLVSPPFVAAAAALSGEILPLLGALGAWALQAWTIAPAVRHHRVPLRYALALPAASAVFGWMTALSAWRHLRGHGVEWKGRILGADTTPAGT